jgi:CheY-like chemotaxis protein
VDKAIAIELIKQVGQLLHSALFIAVGLFLILRFRGAFGDFFRRLSEFSLKTPAGEFSAKAAAEAGVLLGAAQATQQKEMDQSGAPAPAPEVRPEVLADSIRAAAAAAPRLRNRSILWVDDHPANNALIARAIAALGVRIDAVKTTEEALTRLQAAHFDLIITDMTRGRDPDAGLDFIQKAKALDPQAKIIVYSSRRASSKFPGAYNLGAVGATSDPTDLFNRVVALVGT